MEAVLQLVLTNAAAAAVLAGVACVVSRVVRRPALAHALWLIALVKLVTPPLLPLPLLPSWKLVPTLSAPESPTFVRMTADAPPLPRLTTAPAPRLVPARPAAAAAARTEPAQVPNASRLRLLAAGLLSFGAAAVLGLAALRFARFRRTLAWAEPAPPAIEARAARLAAELGLRRVPRVLVVPARIPPMLWPEPSGPRLLLPRDLLPELSAAECDALLAHELAHVRRRDHWVRLIELVVTAAFWWYPLTWWTRRGLRRAEERCCDECVLRVLPRSAQAYANGLLKSLNFIASTPAKLPALASGASPLYELEQRLKEILMSRPAPRLAPPLRLALLAAAAVGLAVFPTHAREDEPRATAAVVTPEADAPQPATPARVLAPAPVSAPVLAVASTTDAQAVSPVPTVAPVQASAAPRSADHGRRAIDEQRRELEAKRRSLQQQELELSRQELELNHKAEQAELRAAAEQLRSEGKTREAELREKQLGTVARRMELERRKLTLEAERLAVEMKLEGEERAQRDKLAALESAGSEDARKAAERELERAEAQRSRAEEELGKSQRAMELEAEALEKEMQKLAAAEQIHAMTEATDEMTRAFAEHVESLKAAVQETGANADLEREIKRIEAALAALKLRTPAPTADKTPRPSPQP